MNDKVKILYVDDEEINLQLFEINFSEKYRVFTAFSGPEALSILDEHPDITYVISDMKMPKMNGLEFIQKSKDKHANKKYFILTGFDITKDIKSALDDNLISKYFRKPFILDEIEASLSSNESENNAE